MLDLTSFRISESHSYSGDCSALLRFAGHRLCQAIQAWIATLFNPLRRAIQAWIARRFYRRKSNAGQVRAAFRTTLRVEIDLDRLSGSILEVVEETVQPAHVSL